MNHAVNRLAADVCGPLFYKLFTIDSRMPGNFIVVSELKPISHSRNVRSALSVRYSAISGESINNSPSRY